MPDAKKRLLQVQEVIAAREFQVGRFYYSRQHCCPASLACGRWSTVTRFTARRTKPCTYSANFVSQSKGGYGLRRRTFKDESKLEACMPEDFAKNERSVLPHSLPAIRDGSRRRRQGANPDLKRPIPRPTKAAVAQNKAEMESRHESTVLTKVTHTFAKHPDVSGAPTKGEPTLVDQQPMSATEVVQEAGRAATGDNGKDSHTLLVETTGGGAPAENEPAPRSDAPPLIPTRFA